MVVITAHRHSEAVVLKFVGVDIEVCISLRKCETVVPPIFYTV